MVGTVVFAHAHTVFNPGEAPDQRLILHSSLAENDTQAKLATLLDGAVDAPTVAVAVRIRRSTDSQLF